MNLKIFYSSISAKQIVVSVFALALISCLFIYEPYKVIESRWELKEKKEAIPFYLKSKISPEFAHMDSITIKKKVEVSRSVGIKFFFRTAPPENLKDNDNQLDVIYEADNVIRFGIICIIFLTAENLIYFFRKRN